MTLQRSTRASKLFLGAAVVCFAAAVAFGIVLPLITTVVLEAIYGVAFLVLGLLILAHRAGLEKR